MTHAIKDFWSENPVGTNFIQGEVDQEFFRKYDDFRYSTEGHILEELKKTDFQGKRVLEIGTGQGSDAEQMIRNGAIYTGVDLTEESIRRLKIRFDLFDLPYENLVVSDAVKLPFPDDSFDVVYSHGVIHHSPDIEEICEEIHRVLKPSGQAVVMLYHRNSYNYRISIALIRRIGLMVSYYLPFFRKLISKATGESSERLGKHYDAFDTQGLGYLRMKNFIHKSTDGPDNTFSSVWSIRTAKQLFKNFQSLAFRIHFLNERHLLGLQYALPTSVKRAMARTWGWHLWVRATK